VSDRVRAANAADAATIATLLQQSFQEFESLYTPEAFSATTPATAEILRRLEEGPVWVAVRGDTVVGTVSAVPRGEELYVRSMAVSPVVRGQGIGRQLLDRVERFAEERGYRRITLSTTPFLSQAIQLYERAGFRRNSEEIPALHGTPLLGMVKELEVASSAKHQSKRRS